MNAESLRQLERLVAEQSTFVHVTHVNPDADGYASALAMDRWLRRSGKDSRVVLAGPPPRRLAFLARDGEIRLAGEPGAIPEAAVFMIYDVSTMRRLGPLQDPVRRSRLPCAVFDHHDGTTDIKGVAVIDASAGATAQVVLDVFEALGVALGQDLAVPLYVGLLTDTGSFNYGKTTPRTHELAGRLLGAGVDPLAIHGELEGNSSLAAVRAAGEVMARIEVDPVDGRVAHATMPHDVFRRGGSDALDMLDVVNATISIEGVRAGVLLIEAEPGKTRLSMRSKGSLSIVETARAFGGGGHANAAGAEIGGPPDAVRPRVLAELRANVAAQLGSPGRS